METIEATFRVVTPMFMSGAEPTKAELRLPSIKGALRFWWRALAWERHGGNLDKIREEENRLFGSTDTGQAEVLMRLEAPTPKPKTINVKEVLKDGGRVVGDGARYLGYGVMNFRGELTRPCLQARFKFTVTLAVKPSSNIDVTELARAVKIMGLLGGIGSKARKGYGSLTLLELKQLNDVWKAPVDVSALLREMKNFINNASFPEFTALSNDSRFVVIEGDSNDSPLSLLNRIGREMVFYRSWGKDGKVLRETREGNFTSDHDLMKGYGADISYPERVAFGLPHNYGKPSHLHVEPNNFDRRASPLFLHIHQVSKEDTPIAVISFLPSVFLPNGEPIKLLNTTVKPVYDHAFWQPVHDFLERMKGEHKQRPLKRRENFSRVVEV